MNGTASNIGTTKIELRSTCAVDCPLHIIVNAMYSSESGRAYEVRASVSSTSPNLPSSVLANPPMLILRSVESRRERPEAGHSDFG